MRPTATAFALLLVFPAWANAPSPYAGMTDRPIRALSAEQQADLLAGRGMGLALAAELNGWPGPAHVIELASAINLTPVQLAATQRLMADMQAAAGDLGARVIEGALLLDHPRAKIAGGPLRAHRPYRSSAGRDPRRASAHASGTGGAPERGTDRRLFSPAGLCRRSAAAWWPDAGRAPAPLT